MSSDYEIVIDVVDSIIENSVNCYADKVQLYQGMYCPMANTKSVVTCNIKQILENYSINDLCFM